VRRALALCLFTGALVLPAPALAQFQFPSSPAPIKTEPEGDPLDSAVAIDASGRTYLAWTDNDTLRLDVREPGGVFTEIFSTPDGFIPLLELDAAGNLTFVWSVNGAGVATAYKPAGGPVGTPVVLDGAAGAGDTSLAVAPNGAAVVAYMDSTNHPQARYRAAGASAFGTASPLDATGGNRNTTAAAITSDGRAIVAWQNVTTQDIDFSLRTPTTGFTGVSDLFNGSTNVFQPRLASDGAGRTYAIWLNNVAVGDDQIQASELPPASTTWASKTNVSPSTDDLSLDTFDLAADPAGNAVAVWDGTATGGFVMSAFKPAGQVWPATNTNTRLSPLGSDAFHGGVTASPLGGFLAGWRLRDATFIDKAQVVARPAGAASWGAPVLLGNWQNSNQYDIGLAVGAGGDAAASFGEGQPGRMQVALGDNGKPPAITLASPSGAVTDKAAAFDFGATDFTGVASSSLDFGDGSVLSDSSPRAATGSPTHVYRNPGGVFSVVASATDARGNTSSVTRSVTVQDATAPLLSKLSLSRKRFAVGKGQTKVSARKRKPKTGTKIRFTLSEPATVKLTFQARKRGFRKGRRCVAKRPKGVKHPRRCVRFVGKRSLTRKAKAAATSVKFSGRIGRRALKAGRYRVLVQATDAARNRSKAKALAFRVVRARRARAGAR
jgi:hypothetical protein